MSRFLNQRQQHILIELCKNDKIGKVLANKAINHNPLTDEDIETLCSLISDEFLRNGIDKDYEATSYGEELEDILDIINHERIISE